MSATFDATTTAEYAAATTAADRSAVIVSALTGTISVKVFNGSNVEKGSGTMAAPWAVASGATVTVGEVSSFTVGGTATPDANWYIRFQNAGVTRWVRGSFGLADSGQDFTWSLATWEAGQTGTIGTATITTTGNTAPVFLDPPTSVNLPETGGTIEFTAVDPEGSTVTYSIAYRNGFSINPTTGLVTVTAAAEGTTGNITVTASDGVLSTPTVCLVIVNATSGGGGGGTGYTGTGTDATYTGNWFAIEDTVTGWDWTHPSSVQGATLGGVYTNGNSTFPSYWKGNRVRNINATWKVLEATQGNYNFSSILTSLNDADYDGAILNVRGWVVNIVDANGANLYLSEWTAPSWLQSPNYQEALRTGKKVRNLLIRDSNIKTKHIALINALSNAGILTHPKLWGQILHTPSSSRGEEAGAQQGNEAATNAAVQDVINAWTSAMGSNSKRLMWTDDMNQWPDLWAIAVTNGGTGARGGSIEGWLKHQYTPGYKSVAQQTMDANGYIGVDESGLILSQGRGFLDENEYYNRGNNDTDNPTKQQQFRMANLRTLQMRRQFNWVDDGYQMNPRQCAWANVLHGHSPNTSPEAWCCLMRSWTRSTNNGSSYADREVKNLEWFLTQRDTTGAVTTPAIQKNHGGNMSNNDALPSNLWYLNVARTGTNIEFELDSRFISGARSIAVKVTWYDSSTENWSLVYNKSSGGTETKTIRGGATNIAKTRTFFLPDFTGSQAIDLRLTSGGNTPFMFVRVIKL